jgi:hypothetical protein
MTTRSTPIEYMANHLFLPPKLPLHDDGDLNFDARLCAELTRAAKDFKNFLPAPTKERWAHILRMIETIEGTVEMTGDSLTQFMSRMEAGGTRHTSLSSSQF